METYFLVVATMFLVRPLTVVFHELGHAIPIILFTKQKATIFIGSYGNREKGLHFTIGLLEVWFIFNPLSRQPGLCQPTGKTTSLKRFIYIAAGPFTSLFIAIITAYLLLSVNSTNDQVNFVLFVVAVSSAIDFFVNITPNSRPLKMSNGNYTHNDGYQLRQILQMRKFSDEYVEAIDLYNKKEYKPAAILFDKFIENGIKDLQIYRLAISAYTNSSEYNIAKRVSNELLQQKPVNSNDYATGGYIYIQLGQLEKAIELMDKSLALDAKNLTSLNNKGYVLNLLERYAEAIAPLDRAIALNDKYAFAYNNRGLAKVKLGMDEEGLKDINTSIGLDALNAYGYLHLGIYYLDRHKYPEALNEFEKAKELDKATRQIDEYLAKAKSLLKS